MRKMVCSLLLGGVMLAGFAAAAPKDEYVPPTPIRLTTEEIDAIHAEAYAKLQKENPAQFQAMKSAHPTLFANVGDTRNFTATNIQTNASYTVAATLRAKGTKSQVWVENTSWNKYVNQATVDSVLDNLESHTGPDSADPNKGIYTIDTEYFGNPPNVDGDGIVDYLILDIQDGYTPGSSSGFVAGYFTSADQGGGNNCDMLYLDAYPGIGDGNGNYATETVMGTAAHELQHLIHYAADRYESTWVNEAMAQAAVLVCGYPPDMFMTFGRTPNDPIASWSGSLLDYAEVQYWSMYLKDRFGNGIFKKIVSNTGTGVTGVNSALSASPYSTTFADVYKNWITANYLNRASANTMWGYTNQFGGNIRCNLDQPTYCTYPVNISRSVKPNSAVYYRFTAGKNLALTFNTSSSYPFARLIKIKPTGAEVVDLVKGTQYTDAAFGDTYSEAVVVVGSTSTSGTTAASFTLAATATQTGMAEAKNDDGISDSYSTTATRDYTGLGVNKADYGWAVQLTRPTGTTHLSKISTFMLTTLNTKLTESAVKVHIWGDNSGAPGADLVTPVSANLMCFWTELDVATLFGAPVQVPEKFYVGFTHETNASCPYMFIDKTAGTTPPNYSWRINPGAAPTRMYDLLNSSNQTFLNGFSLMFRGVCINAPIPVVAGDANADGQIDAVDVTAVLNQLNGNTVTGFNLANADLNNSGALDAQDLVLLCNMFQPN